MVINLPIQRLRQSPGELSFILGSCNQHCALSVKEMDTYYYLIDSQAVMNSVVRNDYLFCSADQ